jgi:hypothetical protein
MSNLLQQAQNVKTLASDPSLPKWQRLLQGFQALSGLDPNAIPDEVHAEFEADWVNVNRVLARYPLEKDEDYQTISEVDLQQMLESVDGAASRTMTAELDRIVAGLEEGKHKLPVEAIEEAREHRDLMVPRLIKVLRDTTSAARADDTPEGNAHFFALFLLSEFHAEESLPAILEVISLPGDLPFDLFGDAITSTLARILAQFAGARPEVLDTLIGDPKLNEYVRWEAAQTYVHLVRDGHLQRDEAVRRLQQTLREALDQKDGEIACYLVSVLTSFGPKEALEDIKEVYERDMMEPFLVSLEEVEQSIAEGEAGVYTELERCMPTGIEDTIEELRTWASFREKPAKRPTPPLPTPPPPAPHFTTSEEPIEPETISVLSRGPRSRRNDPCPCGSGKKFKKCCGARQ